MGNVAHSCKRGQELEKCRYSNGSYLEAFEMTGDLEEITSDDEKFDGNVNQMTPPKSKTRRGSVFAEVYGPHNPIDAVKVPSLEKNSEETAMLTNILQKSTLFNSLTKEAVVTVVQAFEPVEIAAGTNFLVQGEVGDCLYVIESGEVDVLQDGISRTKLIDGDAVGELALLTNGPRIATCCASVNCKLWKLDREPFTVIVRESLIQQRAKYDSFLQNVEIFQYLDTYEKYRLCDCLKERSFKAGETIVSEGKIGSEMYVVKEGECVVLKRNIETNAAGETTVQEVTMMKYNAGGYFGELALLNSRNVRKATVKAKTDVELLIIDRSTFIRYLGPVEQLLRYNADKYVAVEKPI